MHRYFISQALIIPELTNAQLMGRIGLYAHFQSDTDTVTGEWTIFIPRASGI